MPIDRRSGAPLLEIRRRADLIAETLEGITYEDYLAQPQRQASVERHLEVIGEALRRISDADASTASRIPSLQGFIGLRNVIAHGYDRLVQRRIWLVVTSELPSLIAQVDILIKELGEPR